MIEYQRLLEQSNSDLTQFATIASHDLQATLRKIKLFAEQLEVDLKPQLSSDHMDVLSRIHSSAEAMRRLITDLLDLSRITKGHTFTKVDLNSVLNSSLSILSESIQKRDALVKTCELYTIMGDSTQLEWLFQNLIENALKFQPIGQVPEITVTSEIIGNFCTITFADNGIGFLPEHAERIFEPLERLHGKRSYKGTGVGLAICKRIVERHGGSIRAKSKPGNGAMFIIELPVKQSP
jgi:light-regulated signal transduction histidine kinase (bacteriophytochrome)